MTTKDIKKLIAQVKKSKNIIAKERDKLRNLIEEVEELSDNLDQGISEIENGIDTISQTL